MVFAALTPPPKIAKISSGTASTSESAASAASPATSFAPPPVTPSALAPPTPSASTPGFQVDQRVLFRGQRGIVRYIGETNIGQGETWSYSEGLACESCDGFWEVSFSESLSFLKA